MIALQKKMIPTFLHLMSHLRLIIPNIVHRFTIMMFWL